MNPFEKMEQVLLAQTANGGFVLAETIEELNEIGDKHPGLFPEVRGYDQGRVEKGPEGRWRGVFRDANGKVRYTIDFQEK